MSLKTIKYIKEYWYWYIGSYIRILQYIEYINLNNLLMLVDNKLAANSSHTLRIRSVHIVQRLFFNVTLCVYAAQAFEIKFIFLPL